MEGATVRVINVTKGEYVEWATVSDGSFAADLANSGFATDYENNDKLQVCVYSGNKSTWFRHTVNTAVGVYDAGTINMHVGRAILGASKIIAGSISNQDASTAYAVTFYDVSDDSIVIPKQFCGTKTTIPLDFTFIGIKFAGGICVIRDTDAANTVEVTLVVR